MFKRIRSKRDPRDTVYSELKKEFSPYMLKAKQSAGAFATKNTRPLFWLMVACLILSALLALTVFKSDGKRVRLPKPVLATGPVGNSFRQIIATGDAIKEMLALQKMIDSLDRKKQLTGIDSARLDSALDKFQQLNHKFNQHP
jgi:hypothetical protein